MFKKASQDRAQGPFGSLLDSATAAVVQVSSPRHVHSVDTEILMCACECVFKIGDIIKFQGHRNMKVARVWLRHELMAKRQGLAVFQTGGISQR